MELSEPLRDWLVIFPVSQGHLLAASQDVRFLLTEKRACFILVRLQSDSRLPGVHLVVDDHARARQQRAARGTHRDLAPAVGLLRLRRVRRVVHRVVRGSRIGIGGLTKLHRDLHTEWDLGGIGCPSALISLSQRVAQNCTPPN